MVAWTQHPHSTGIPWEPGPIWAHATNWAETTAWLCPESTRTHFPLVALLGPMAPGAPGAPGGGTKLGMACLECPKKNPVPCKWLLVMFRVARPMPFSLLKQSLLFVHVMLKIERRSRSKHENQAHPKRWNCWKVPLLQLWKNYEKKYVSSSLRLPCPCVPIGLQRTSLATYLLHKSAPGLMVFYGPKKKSPSYPAW